MLGGVVLFWTGDESEVFPLNFMCIHKSAIALLLDGERTVVGGFNNPFLSVVALFRTGDESEIFLRNLMCIHKPGIAFLLDGVRAIPYIRKDPFLGIIMLCWTGLESPGFAQNFGSCGEAEGLHLVGVLTFDDEFREDVGLIGIQEKFRKALA